MFNYKDIQWVRNVKRDGGQSWAYFDDDEDEMILHWSSAYTKQPTHAMKPEIGDLVVLFQKLTGDRNVHFTHLLTPVDDIELDCVRTIPNYRWGRRMKILAKTKELLKPTSFNLTSVNQGHTYSVDLLNKDLDTETIQKIIWNAFHPYFRSDISKGLLSEIKIGFEEEILPDFESPEGKWLLAMHRYRERDNSLVAAKKASVKNPTCECCDFNFSNTYPNLGDGFIECHHRIPIHQGERITRIEDLALVCANCHRMLHKKNNQNNYYTVEELKQIIAQ